MFTPSKEQIELNQKFSGKRAILNSSGLEYKIIGAHVGDNGKLVFQAYLVNEDGTIRGRNRYFEESQMTLK